MKMFFRGCWAFAGLILSAPAFLPPLGWAIAVWGIGLSHGVSVPHLLAVVWHEPRGFAVMSVAVLYCVYWTCVSLLVVQFVLDLELALVPVAIVVVAMVSTLVALQPWHDPGVAFMLGPFALLHVVFMATVAWPSFRRSRTMRGRQRNPPESAH